MKTITQYYKDEDYKYLEATGCYTVNTYIKHYNLTYSSELFYRLLREINKTIKN